MGAAGHHPDGHDGICVTCGLVLSPVTAVQHFGAGVLTAAPGDRVLMVLARKERMQAAWVEGVPIPSPRSGCDVVRDLRREGIDVAPKSCRPPREPSGWIDAVAALSRAVDRVICRAMAPKWTRQAAIRRRRAARRKLIRSLTGKGRDAR